MAKSRNPPINNKHELTEEVRFRPEQLYASAPSTATRRQSRQRSERVREMIAEIIRRFIATLGTSADYTVEFVEPDLNGVPSRMFRGLNIAQIVPKTNLAHPKTIEITVNDLVADTRSVLLHADLSMSEIKNVVQGVRMGIWATCEKYYTITDNEITIIDDYAAYVNKAQPDDIGAIQRGLPDAILRILTRLASLVDQRFFQEKIEHEIRELSLPERIVELSKRTKAAAPEDMRVLERILRRLMSEHDQMKEINGAEASIRDNELKPVGRGTQDNPPPTEGEELISKPLLTVDQFIMLMYAIGGSRLKGLDKKRVAVGLSALTGNVVSQFINRFSQVLSNDDGIKKFTINPDAYNKDVEKVCSILTEMGLTDEVSKLKENSGV